jgi:hypothetical protein
MRVLRLLLVLICASAASGCYVVSLSGLGEATPQEVDESLLGHWRSAEDEVEVEIARDEWRTFSVTLRGRGDDQRFTGRLSPIGGARVFDLTIHVGTESGPALIPVHVIGRLTRQEDSLVVELPDYEWFSTRHAKGTLGTPAVLDDRETLLLTAPRAQLRRWLAGRMTTPGMFTELMTLTRDTSSSK